MWVVVDKKDVKLGGLKRLKSQISTTQSEHSTRYTRTGGDSFKSGGTNCLPPLDLSNTRLPPRLGDAGGTRALIRRHNSSFSTISSEDLSEYWSPGVPESPQGSRLRSGIMQAIGRDVGLHLGPRQNTGPSFRLQRGNTFVLPALVEREGGGKSRQNRIKRWRRAATWIEQNGINLPHVITKDDIVRLIPSIRDGFDVGGLTFKEETWTDIFISINPSPHVNCLSLY